MGEIDLSSIRDKVFAFENEMKALPQVELEVKHHFAYGVYGRELYIPKDIILTGQIHKYTQLNLLVKGRMAVFIDNVVKEIEAPFIVVSPAGTKRIAKALEDCIWVTVHGTDKKDLKEIEDYFIAKDEVDYLEFQKLLLTDK